MIIVLLVMPSFLNIFGFSQFLILIPDHFNEFYINWQGSYDEIRRNIHWAIHHLFILYEWDEIFFFVLYLLSKIIYIAFFIFNFHVFIIANYKSIPGKLEYMNLLAYQTGKLDLSISINAVDTAASRGWFLAINRDGHQRLSKAFFT